MKKYFAFLLLIGVVSIAFIALADNPAAPAADVQALKNQIAELQSRVQKLEDQARTLESTVQTMQQPRLVPLLQQSGNPLSFKIPPSHSQQPKIWGQREVNGWAVYTVPCEQGQ
jgi:hypothetical protein